MLPGKRVSLNRPGSWTSDDVAVSQVFVVSEAYSYSPDWAHILHQKVVLDGDFGYLEELKRRRPLTSALFEDIFKR